EHTGAPDDPAGRHFDLLLEQGAACRTWRLIDLPQPGGPAVAALELPPHRLAWLDTVAADVSGGRGHARRVAAGTFEPLSLDADSLSAATVLVLKLVGEPISGRLRLESIAAGWRAILTDA
ncbi:hypothetical protein EBZ02_09955, partial [bacterium]|nr:hypothetical protein [bacterium]